MPKGTCHVGLIGLGAIGRNLALNLSDRKFSVAVWNKERDWTGGFLAANPGGRFVACRTIEQVVSNLPRPRRILLMVTAGEAVDAVIRNLAHRLSAGDIVADGGNSLYSDTARREGLLAAQGILYLGLGISGGTDGARHGPSIMAGGSRRGWAWFRPILEEIAARGKDGPCAGWFGPGGAGHFVKMVHNGIEYAELQAIAEIRDLLRAANGLDAGRVSRVFSRWNRGPLESFLLATSAEVLGARDEEGRGFLVDRVVDAAGQKGTGNWTVRAAADLGIPVPSVAAAVDARNLSARRAERARLASARRAGRPIPEKDLRDALFLARLAAFAQGLDLLRAANDRYGWEAAWSETARVWEAGCIIRCGFLAEIRRAALRNPALPHLFLDGAIRSSIVRAEKGARRVIAAAAASGIPAAAIAAGLSYWDAWRAGRLPQDLVQLARDRFGAHGFERTDRRGTSRGPW